MVRRLPSLNALRVFEVAARKRSFKDAAEELHVTQSAVSRQIQSLEDQLGLQLFRRMNRAVALTPDGEALLPTLSESFDNIAKTLQSLKPANRRAERLVIAVSPGVAEMWLGKRLAEFCQTHPHIEPEITVAVGFEPIVTGAVEVSIFWGTGNLPDVAHEPLMTLTEFPVCAPSSATRVPIENLADLQGKRLLHWRSRKQWRDWLAAVGAEGIGWNQGPILHDYALYLDMAVAGDGIALSDDLMAANHLYEGRLVKPLAVVHTSPYQQHLLISNGAKEEPAVAEFCAWVRREIAQHRRETRALRKPEPFAMAAVTR